MNILLNNIQTSNQLLSYIARKFEPLSLLLLRLYISSVFFPAGLLKIQNWDTTLFLFEEEYHVPFLPPEFAAWAGTAGELILPIFITLGLLTRFSSIGLFLVNIVAVMSLTDMGQAAESLHVLWGLVLFVLMLWGPGNLSTDKLISVNKNEK